MNMYRRIKTVVLKANLTKILNNYCCFKVNIIFMIYNPRYTILTEVNTLLLGKLNPRFDRTLLFFPGK